MIYFYLSLENSCHIQWSSAYHRLHSRHVLCLVVATIIGIFYKGSQEIKMKWLTFRFLNDGTAIRKLFDRELQWKAFTLIFQLLCILLALLLAYLCYGEFLRNEDFCVVTFKKMYNRAIAIHSHSNLLTKWC